MNFYEVKEPYYALIMAKNEEEAYHLYVNTVADDYDNNLQEEIKLLDREVGIIKYSRGLSEDKELIDIKEIIDNVKGFESKVLLIDGSLL